MPPLTPTTGEAVLELVRRAELADADALAAFARDSGPVPTTAAAAATRLVQAGLLTPFQAKLILRGKYKGFRLGPYRILDQIGAGGMGQVFLAEHTRMHRRVAVKVLPRTEAADPAEVERFYREARAAAALDHPNIVRAYDVDRDGDTHFLVMEYVEGVTLARLLADAGGVLPVAEACGYAVQALDGLRHAHERRIVHRDVHPGNLLIGPDGVLKIVDMGIARFFREEPAAGGHGPGAVMGTADYIAPEQAMGSADLDHRADVYSLGATLYHLVTGRPPFAGSTAAKLLAHQLHDVPPAHEVRPGVPEGLSAVIGTMMAKDPAERYQSAEEAAAALVPFAEGAGEAARPDEPTVVVVPDDRRPLLILAGVLALLLVVALIVAVVAVLRD